MEHPVAGYASHRQERSKTPPAFVHGGTSWKLSESGGSPVLEAHPGSPVEITGRRPFLPMSPTAQRLYHGSDEELLKFERKKLGTIEEGVKKDGVAAKGYFSVGHRVASSENESTMFLAKRMAASSQPFFIPAKVPEDEELPQVPATTPGSILSASIISPSVTPPVTTPGSISEDDKSIMDTSKSLVDTSVESTAMDFDFETDNGVWISAHPKFNESRASLASTTTAFSAPTEYRYSQALTVDTSVASSAASMMSSVGSIQSATTATSSDMYGWEEELDRKVSIESGNPGWNQNYITRIGPSGERVGPRGRGGLQDYPFRRTDGKRRSLLHRVLNLSGSRRTSLDEVTMTRGLSPQNECECPTTSA